MSNIKAFKEGFVFMIRGFTFLAARPKLWVWAVLPTIVNLLLLGLMVGVFFHYYSSLYSWLAAHLGISEIAGPLSWWQHLLNALIFVAEMLIKALIVLLTLVLLLLVSYGLSFVVAGPFNDALSERVERIATGMEPPPFSLSRFIKETVRTIKVESIKAAILLAIPVVLFLLSFIPVVGGPLYIVLTFIFGAWDIGFCFADIPNSRRALPFKERWKFAREQRWALIGLGLGFVIPFFSLIFAAPMVVGGTLLYVDRQGRVIREP